MNREIDNHEYVPSQKKELLDRIKGEKLIKLTRFSWWEGSEAMEQCEIEADEVFSLTTGPLLLYLGSGLVVGAASDPSRNSVTLWVEKDEAGYISNEPIELDSDLYPIDAQDKIYSNSFWDQIIGHKIKEIDIYQCDPYNSLYIDLPNEVGVVITMENDKKFILSHGLHDDSDTFSVLPETFLDDTEDLVKIKGLKF